jgi:hypothetical protein
MWTLPYEGKESNDRKMSDETEALEHLTKQSIPSILPI